MRSGIAALFAAAAAAMSVTSGPHPGYAADWVGKATEQQQAHCAALEELSFRGPCLFTYSVRGLTFPDKAEEPGIFTKTARMGIFKPKGEGPFPALLILHSCAAVDFDPDHIQAWVNRAVKEGYVAFVVDSWGQRGIPELCRTSPPGFLSSHLYVRARDGYEALAHLRKFSFVDIARVGAVGFSNGGRTSYMLGSAQMAQAFSPDKLRFAALAAVYGQCLFMRPDVDRPILALLGELDEDGNPRDCVPRFRRLKDLGIPVEWHVFPKIGHAWDSPKFRIPQRLSYLGSSEVLFAYDANVAEGSRNRVFEFFARYLKT